MPFNTEFAAVKVAASVCDAKVISLATPLDRSVNATSDGELVRVGTVGVRTVSESAGKTRWISTSTAPIVDTVVPKGDDGGEGRRRDRRRRRRHEVVTGLDLGLA